jgi:hypothetical protein
VNDKHQVFSFLGQRQRLKNFNEEKEWFGKLTQEYQNRLNANQLPRLEQLFSNSFLQFLEGGSD